MGKEIYSNLSKLVLESRSLESQLEDLGGEGKGMWEKADSISHILPKGFADKVLCLALVRNKAMHGSPKINNISTHLEHAKMLKTILDMERLNKDVKKTINHLSKYNIDFVSNKSFDKFFKYVAKVQKYQGIQNVSLEELSIVLNEQHNILTDVDNSLQEIDKRKKKKNIFRNLLMHLLYMAIILGISYLLWKGGI